MYAKILAAPGVADDRVATLVVNPFLERNAIIIHNNRHQFLNSLSSKMHLGSEESDLQQSALEEKQIVNSLLAYELTKQDLSEPPIGRQSVMGKIHPDDLFQEESQCTVPFLLNHFLFGPFDIADANDCM